jgi:PAS domain S-box-containing protein
VPWDHIILGLKRTTKEFVENILENIIESIVVTDLSGRLVLFNRHSQEMFGYSAEEGL